MYSAYNYFNIFSAPLACLFAIGKSPLWALGCYLLAFIVHPSVDWLMNNPLKSIVDKLQFPEKKSLFYELPLFFSVPFQMFMVFVAFDYGSSTFLEAIISGSLCGLSGGILGIASSHELIHRTNKISRMYGQVMLYTINYPHFYIEHLLHHVTVATPEDADTGRKGESIYKFLIRSVPEGWLKCWTWTPYRKKMLRTTLIQVSLMAGIFLIGGMNVLMVFVVQGIVTLLLLKWINYVEHYGLERKVINGSLEPVGMTHSWDSLSPLTNFSLFNLGFHTQHHKRPSLKYYKLPESTPSWNSLPYGYSTLMMMALLPNVWIGFMDNQIQKMEKALCSTGKN